MMMKTMIMVIIIITTNIKETNKIHENRSLYTKYIYIYIYTNKQIENKIELNLIYKRFLYNLI